MQVFFNVFVHIPGDERMNLDDMSHQCIFIGYDYKKFGYKLYDPDSKKVIRCRDITIFDEDIIGFFNPKFLY